MRPTTWTIAGTAAIAASVAGASLMSAASAQQGVPAPAPKPATGAAQPSPANSQPGQTNPTPRPANNPGTVQPQVVPNRPTTPPGRQPATPAPTTIGPNGQPIAVVPGVGTTTGSGVVSTGAPRYERPFAFVSPGAEARFTDTSRRLLALESRMNLSNQTLLRRLGEARAMSPDKQNAALADIIQQMLLDQQQMQKYLVQARTAWTGELEPLPAELPEDATPVASPPDAPQPVGQTPGHPSSQTPTQVPAPTQVPVPTNPPR